MRQYTLTFGLLCALCLFACVETQTERPVMAETTQSPATAGAPITRSWFSGTVRHAVSLEPITGVSVHVIGTQYSTQTDSLGAYTLPLLPGFERVETRLHEFQTSNTRVGVNTLLWPLHVSDLSADSILRRRRLTAQDSDDLDDPDLTENARRLISHHRATGHWNPAYQPHIRRLKQGIVAPPTIRIYRRGPENNSCEGRVDVIVLEDYVKGVVPHEWIPSWSDESLRAGSIAARSYSWGWIVAGGKYDCADLDDTTRSQVYRDDRTQRATAATDSTRGVGVIRDGQIVRAEYSAENGDPTEFGVDEPLCTGRDVFGHGRGMCQWGTQRWSTQRGQTAEWMVQHYYPGATTSGNGTPQAPTPHVTLRQRLARVDAITCPDPDTMFECADFVNQAWSQGIFDLFVGHQMRLTIEVGNEGDGTADDVMVDLDVSGPYLSVSRVETVGSYEESGRGRHHVEFDAIAPGEMSTVVLTIQGEESNVTSGQPATVKTWISAITSTYQKPDWALPPTLNEGQTFNGGELRLMTEVDVFSPRHWTWASGDEDMYEGWSNFRGVQSMRGSNSGLFLEVTGGSGIIDSPYLPRVLDPIEQIRIITQPAVPCRIWWRSPAEAFDGSRSLVLNGPLTRMAEGTIPEDVEQLRLDVSGSTQIVELQLGAAGSIPTIRDAATLGNNDARPRIENRDATVNGGTADARRPTNPNEDPPPGVESDRQPRALSVRSVGGCATNGGTSAPVWLLALVLLVGFRKRAHENH